MSFATERAVHLKAYPLSMTWYALFLRGYKLEFWHPAVKRWQRIHELGGFWFVQNGGWCIRLAKGQVWSIK